MTPQEKASHILRSYEDSLLTMYHFVNDNDFNNDDFKKTVKRCAIICVDEMIKRNELLRKPENVTFIEWEQLKEKTEADTWDGIEEFDFLEQIKQEIEKA